MEDPKSFSAPITALDEAPAPTDKLSVSSEKSATHHERRASSEQSESTKESNPKDETNVDAASPSALEANLPKTSSASDSNQENEKADESIDPNIVDWDGPNDPSNPMNWPKWKVKTHIFLISIITFVT